MRQYLHGIDNTSYGAKFAREHYLTAHPDHTAAIGHDSMGYFMDILRPAPKPVVLRMPAQLRLVVNNG